MGSFLMSLLGGIAQHYAKGDPPSGGWAPGSTWTYLAQKEHWAGDNNRFAPKIVRKHEDWPYQERPYSNWPFVD